MTDFDSSLCDLSAVYHALSASRRCNVIQLLWKSEQECIAVRELARKIAAIEENVDPGLATGEPYRNVYNALSQTHLSTLSETDIVIYDSDRKMVAVGPKFDIAALFLFLNQTAYQALEDESISIFDDSNQTAITD